MAVAARASQACSIVPDAPKGEPKVERGRRYSHSRH
jgi:hypothetical protein